VRIKFITLNIWRGGLLKNAVNFFKEENPDIINLQEVYDGKDFLRPNYCWTFDYLKKTFPEYEAVFEPQLCDITPLGNIEEGNATFSKFPIKVHDITFFDIPYSTFDNHVKTSFEDNPQSLLHSEIKIGEKKINVYNVHGIWGRDGLDSPRRYKMVETILERINGKENVILAGDFNISPETEAVKRIEEKLTSVFGTTLKKLST
jgi:endonuclease/exonuclease/phosphatase family metal-dependent hydrolase